MNSEALRMIRTIIMQATAVGFFVAVFAIFGVWLVGLAVGLGLITLVNIYL